MQAEEPAIPTPPRTSLEAIVAAGRALIEESGLDGLTMQGVARAVGVRGPSLYKRVRSRGDLLRLIVEDVAREATAALDAAASTEDPRGDLLALASAFRSFAHAHPAGYALLFAPLPGDARPDTAVLGRASGAVLRTAAALAGEDKALEAARTVVAWAHGFVSMELAGAFQLGGDVDAAYAFGAERLADALATHLRGPVTGGR